MKNSHSIMEFISQLFWSFKAILLLLSSFILYIGVYLTSGNLQTIKLARNLLYWKLKSRPFFLTYVLKLEFRMNGLLFKFWFWKKKIFLGCNKTSRYMNIILKKLCQFVFIYSSFGNVLTPTSNWLELIFCCIITLSGLALFVTLIGNIQVTLKSSHFHDLIFLQIGVI